MESRVTIQQINDEVNKMNSLYINILPPHLSYLAKLVSASEMTQPLIPIESVFYSIVYEISSLLLRKIPELFMNSLFHISRRAIVFFPCDASIPYELIMIRDRHGRLNPLFSRNPIGRIIGESIYDTAALSVLSVLYSLKPRDSISVLIVSNPTKDLPLSSKESDVLKDVLINAYKFNAKVLAEDNAKFNIILTEMLNYDIIHFSTHGGLDENGQPFLYLSDKCLFGKDIPDLHYKNPIIFANACLSGASENLQGNTGLASAFIKKGALAYIGTLWGVRDYHAAARAARFYDNSMEDYIGSAMSTFSFALGDEPTHNAYILFGDPLLSILEPPLSSREAYYYNQLGSELENMEQDDRIIEIIRLKEAFAFLRLSDEFKERATKDFERRSVWHSASRKALARSFFAKANAYALKSNIASQNLAKIKELEKAAKLFIEMGKIDESDKNLSIARSNYCLGMIEYYKSKELNLEDQNINEIIRLLGEAVKHLEISLDYETHPVIRKSIISMVSEFKGDSYLYKSLSELFSKHSINFDNFSAAFKSFIIAADNYPNKYKSVRILKKLEFSINIFEENLKISNLDTANLLKALEKINKIRTYLKNKFILLGDFAGEDIEDSESK